MPRGYRYVLLATVGLATGASEHKGGTETPQAQTAGNIAQASPAPPVRPPVETVPSAKYQPPCRDPKDHDRCDLEAQWKAADAADKSAWWAAIQAWLSLAGIVGLIYSLVLTRRATKVAVEATEDADKALEIAAQNAIAAREQVYVTRETAARQLRPYLYLTSIVPTFQHFRSMGVVADVGTLDLIVENFGPTPAKNVELRARSYIGEYWTDLAMPDLTSAAIYPLGDIPLGFKKHVPGYSVVGLKLANQEIAEGNATIFFEGELAYDDGMGTRCYTRFRLCCSGEDYAAGRFQIAKYGNEAT